VVPPGIEPETYGFSVHPFKLIKPAVDVFVVEL